MPISNVIFLNIFARILESTREGRIDWKQVSPRLLTAKLDGYELKLEEVEDFDGAPDDEDHILSVSHKGQPLFSLDRRDVTADQLSSALGGQEVAYSYHVFRELWDLAYLRASNLSTHLRELDRLLKAQPKL